MKEIALETEENGTKFDQDKPRMDLLDPKALTEVAKVMTFGAKKYGDHNWRGGLRYSRFIAASLRHIMAYLGGEDTDQETGLSHIAHAMCCLMMLLGTSKDLDDRYYSTSIKREFVPDGYGGYTHGFHNHCAGCNGKEKKDEKS